MRPVKRFCRINAVINAPAAMEEDAERVQVRSRDGAAGDTVHSHRKARAVLHRPRKMPPFRGGWHADVAKSCVTTL